jgi:hypothetical protein
VASQGVSDSTTEQFQLLADQLKDINRQLAADTRSLEQST